MCEEPNNVKMFSHRTWKTTNPRKLLENPHVKRMPSWNFEKIKGLLERLFKINYLILNEIFLEWMRGKGGNCREMIS